MSFPSLQHRLSVSLIIASHVLEQTSVYVSNSCISQGTRLEDYFVLVLIFLKDFQLQPEFSQTYIYGDKPDSSLSSKELEDLYPSCDVLIFILRFINILK